MAPGAPAAIAATPAGASTLEGLLLRRAADFILREGIPPGVQHTCLALGLAGGTGKVTAIISTL